MPRKNMYVIFDKKKNKYYTGGDNWNNQINNAWHFGETDLLAQKNMLERNNDQYEIIIKIMGSGELLRVA